MTDLQKHEGLRWSTHAVCLVVHQGARCGEGLRFRNVSCFVSDGSSQQDRSMVDDDLCGDLEPTVDGDPNIIVQEPCTVPCPGKRTVTQTGPLVVGFHCLTSFLFFRRVLPDRLDRLESMPAKLCEWG